MNDLRAIYIIWLRELKRYWYDKVRMIASLGQPILFLFVLGIGLSPAFSRNGNIDYVKFLYPGIISMPILFTSIFSAVSIIWDREFGFLKEILVAPVSRSAIAIGKAAGGSTVAVFQGALILLLSPFVGIHLTFITLLKLLPLMFLIAFALNGLGIIIAANMKSMEGFTVVVNFIIMPMFFLSGALFPLNGLPAWLTVLTRLDPLTYAVDALRRVVINEGVFPIYLDITVMFLFAIVTMAIAVFEFNFSENNLP